ncbi:MAG: PHP domain-containing protein, partial [Chloroflexi bacterium]|nr:PHP domain-containing protein [Chloroflexota bacterium]
MGADARADRAYGPRSSHAERGADGGRARGFWRSDTHLIRLADYHIHTRFSIDSETGLEEACETAIARGLSEIAFTDHADFGPDDTPGYFRPAEYVAAVERCRAR